MADASELIARRKQELERRLAELAPSKRAQVEESWQAPATAQPRTIPRRPEGTAAPMSYAQELLWLLERTNPGHTYNVSRSVRLRGSLDIPALQHALDALVRRHEALRTTFQAVGGAPSQIVHPPAAVPLNIVTPSVTDDDSEGAARAAIRELASRPFDLARDLQLQAHLIRLGDEDHVLLLLSHHIVSDGWSGGIVLRELAALYHGFVEGRPTDLPELPVQYADYATWQRDLLSGPTMERMLAYWRDRLAGAPTSIDFPTDRPRRLAQGGEGAWRTTALPAAVADAVRELTRTTGATPFVVFLSTFFVLLHRYSNEEELIIGSPVAGRTLPELDGVVGYFTNTLLLRASTAGDPTVRQLIEQVRGTWLSAYDHQDVPLERLLLERGPSGEPIAEVPRFVLITDGPDRDRFQLHGLTATPIGASRGATKFDLTLRVSDTSAGITLGIEYRTDLFDAATIERMLGQFGKLLEGAARTPDARISHLPLISAAERQRVLVDWNGASPEYPRTATVDKLFMRQVAATPHATALVAGDTSLSYAELSELAARVARALRLAGVRPGEFVAIAADRSVESVAAMLAVLQVGGAYLPLDPQYPVDRLAFILRDTECAVVLAQEAVREPIARAIAAVRHGSAPLTRGLRLLLLEETAAATPGHLVAAIADTPAAPDGAAYLMYTSGSTGQPKGVVVPHRAIIRLVRGADYAELGADQTILAAAPLSFDASTLEIWGALLNGGRLVLAPAGPIDPQTLGRLIATHRVTTLWLTAALFQHVVDADIEALAGVRQLLAGGDVLPVPQVRRVLERFADCRVINGYGPTENTTFTCCYTIPRDWPSDTPIPIGRPVANTKVYILDATMAPVPPGMPGELFAGGDGVALGYHARPELTGERFLADPFRPGPRAQLYRTGDRVRWRNDGTIEFLGRLDTQVKIRGFRIELGEIEAALLALDGIGSAVAVAREDAPGNKQVAAYVVPSPGRDLSVTALRDRLRLTLPAAMLPATITVLDRLPITANGKLDRKALPVPAEADRAARTYAPPTSPVEGDLASVWASILGLERVGVEDDFIDLGGSSLLAMRMIAEVERRWDWRIPFQAFYEKPTIANLAAIMLAGAAETSDAGAAVLQRDGPGTPFAFVHGDAMGYGWYCRRLAPLLGPAPLVVLPTLGPRTAHGATSTEAIALVHLSALRRLQSRGPYRLGGFCHGALVAYEMARQLVAAGERVERLVLVDPFCSNLQFRKREPDIERLTSGLAPEAQVERRAEFYGRLQYRAQRWRQLRSIPLPAQLRWLVAYAGRKLGIRSAAPRIAVAPPDDSGYDDQDLHAAMADARATLQFVARAQRAFMPAPYAGHVDLIWARDALAVRPWLDRWGGWNQVAPDIRLYQVPGTHATTISPDGLPALAEQLRIALDGAQPDDQSR